MPKDKLFTGGTPVPCRDFKVQTNQLAVMLFAFAFWALRQQGAVALALGPKKGLIFKHTPVLVRQLQTAQSSGLEAVILQMVGGASETDVRDVIYRWFGRDVTWPHKTVISVAVEEAIAFGLGAKGGGGIGSAIKGMFSGSVSFEPACDRIAPLESLFNSVLAAWNSFQTGERQLCDTLIQECKRGLDSRVDRSTRTTGGDF